MHYYLTDRTWDQDGFQSVAGALDAASTDPDLVGNPATADDAAQVASGTVHYLTQRDDFDDVVENMGRGAIGGTNGASESFAHILSTYVVGADPSVVNSEGAPGGAPDVVNRLYVDGVGYVGNVPVFDNDSLKKFSLLALATDDGFNEVRSGLNEYRAEKLGMLADNVTATQDDPDTRINEADAAREALQSGIEGDAELEGMFLNAIGDERIGEGEAADERAMAWINGTREIVDLIPVPGASKLDDATEGVLNLVVDGAQNQGEDFLEARYANNEATQIEGANEQADELYGTSVYTVAQILDERGLSADPGGMTDVARPDGPDGSVLSFEDYIALGGGEQSEVRSQLLSSEIGVGYYFDQQAYEEAFRTEFSDYFEEGDGDGN